jgi:formylglycine-generating enzyme required for sulfatase activity
MSWVLRGGSWNGNARNARAADRYGVDPDTRSNLIGFRCVRLPKEGGMGEGFQRPRLLPGGSYLNDAWGMRAASHSCAHPGCKYDSNGFRCVRIAPKNPRLLLGGAYGIGAGNMRTAFSYRSVPGSEVGYIGFRCVRSSHESPDVGRRGDDNDDRN